MTTYLLATNETHDDFWYGYFHGSDCYWSNWYSTIMQFFLLIYIKITALRLLTKG